MSIPPYLEGTGHWQVAGATGSRPSQGGKTTTTNALHASFRKYGFDQSVFFDSKAKPNVLGYRVNSVAEIQQAWDRGERLFHFVPESSKGIPEVDPLYYDFLLEVPGRTVVYWDESADYDESPREALQDAVRKGGNEPQIKSVCIAQRPTDMTTDVRSQLTTFVWIGPATSDLRGYCRQKQEEAEIDDGRSFYEIVKERHTRPYMWTVFDSGRADTYGPVPEGFA